MMDTETALRIRVHELEEENARLRAGWVEASRLMMQGEALREQMLLNIILAGRVEDYCKVTVENSKCLASR